MTAAIAAPTLTDDAIRVRVLDAIRDLKGPFTLPDLCAKTGLPPYVAEPALSKVVRDYTADLDVDDAGTIVYRVDPSLSAREDIVKADAGRRRKAAFKRGLIAFFKGWTVAMVIAYFVIYVVLLIAMLAAMAKGRDSNDNSSRRSGRGGFGGPGWWSWGGIWGTGGYGGYGSRRSRQAERRWNEETEGRLRRGEDPYAMREAGPPPKPSLRERTWYHLFGAAGIARNPLEAEKELLTYLRAKKGLVTNADIIALLGVTYDEADAIGTRLVATYEGEMDLTDDGVAIYRFPNLMITGAPEVAAQPARLGYLWQLRRQEQALRDNPARAVPILNFVNIILGLVTWGVVLPFFHWEGLAPLIGLVLFPLLFSFIFFALGLRRRLAEAAGKNRYERDSIRIAIMQLLFVRRTPVQIPRDEPALKSAGFGTWSAGRIREVADDIAQELRGEVIERGAGFEIKAPRLLEELSVVDRLRARTSSAKPVGKTVFTTRDDAPGANAIGDVVEPGQHASSADQGLADEIAKLEKELSTS